jgi:hypothetical protein
MLKDKKINIQKYIININNYLNNHWLLFFNTVLILFLFELIMCIVEYIKTDKYYNIHNEIFVMSLICFVSIYFIKVSVLWFLVPFLIVRTFNFHPIFIKFQDYFFNKSIFAHLFENLGSKDINVIIIYFFVFYLIGIFLFLIGYKIIKKKWHLKSSFLFITIFVYLITTFLFHYFFVEKNYRNIINNEMTHMEKVAQAEEKDFFIICKNQEYICATDIIQINNALNNKELNKFVEKNFLNYKIKGNFSFGDNKNIYLIIKNKRKWVINPDLAKKSFKETENYLMICLDIAHTCWLFFFIWLNLFHFKKQLIKN